MTWRSAVIEVEGYKIVKRASVELGKVVLYGPNAAGKTSVAEIAAAVMSGSDRLGERTLVQLSALRKEFRLIVRTGAEKGKRITETRFKDGLFTLRVTEEERIEERSYSVPSDLLREVSSIHSLEMRVAWADPCTVHRSEGIVFTTCSGITSFSLLDWMKPEEIEQLEEHLADVTGNRLDGLRRTGDSWWARFDGRWLEIRNLAFGVQRAIAVIASLMTSDALIVEGFEAGLHVDLALALVDKLGELASKAGKIVVVETHHVAAMTYALEKGWNVYYMEDGEIVKSMSSVSDLRDVDLFKREMEAYGLVYIHV